MDKNSSPFEQYSLLILGCGNILFGDDGFGPAVIEHLNENYTIPHEVCLINAGSSARKFLFSVLLDEKRPQHIMIIDAVDIGRKPGEVFQLPLELFPEIKIDDFSMHQIPTSNLLKELEFFCKVKITIVSAQVKVIPEEVQPGLSMCMQNAVKEASKEIHTIIQADIIKLFGKALSNS